MNRNLHSAAAPSSGERTLPVSAARCSVVPVELRALPLLVGTIAHRLKAAGASHFAFFGGAIRDADYSARHGEVRRIKDYDIRVWFSDVELEAQRAQFLGRLAQLSGRNVQVLPCPGTNKEHYVLPFQGTELDISIRGIPAIAAQHLPEEAVAQERAADGDIGLCSVALDPAFRAWARPEYLVDQAQKTLTIFPIVDLARKAAYTARMLTKFPSHRVVEC